MGTEPVLEGPVLRLRLAMLEETTTILGWLDPETLSSMNLEDPVYLDMQNMPERFANLPDQILMHKVLGTVHDSSVTAMYSVSQKPVELVFAITQKSNDALVGVIVLRVSILHQVGTVRTVMAPEYRRRGFGTEAKTLILSYAFDQLGLYKLCSHLLKHNEATFRMNVSLGFKVEGEFEEHVNIGGKRCTLLMMSITRQKWKSGNHPESS